ncbi:Salicylic acid-binding protein 2 [Bienertia sinuspersici]
MCSFIANAGERDKNFWLDTEFKSNGDPEETLTTMLFGPHFTTKLYHLSPHVDFELAMALKRPSSMFLHDLSKPEAKLSKERYGSVERVYVICEEDQVISRAFQRWMIENYGLKEVKELKGSDHMPMFSVPQQLCDCLLELAQH